MNLILVLLGILVTFFIPGYILATLFLKNVKFRIPISIGLSICIVTFVGFILGLFGFLRNGYLWGAMVLLILIPTVYYKKEFLKELRKVDIRNIFNKKNLLILFLLLVVFFAVYFVRFGPSQLYIEPQTSGSFFIPIHGDEWTHLAQAKYSINSGQNSFVNPYFKNLPKHLNFESGFHTFTVSFFLLTGLDIVANYYFLAAVFAMIVALLIYPFLFLLTKQRIAGIFGVLFFLSLPSNSSLLGSWFYVPSSMSIFLIFLFLTLLYQARENINFYFLGFILIISLLTYPFVAILLGIISLFYIIQDRDMLRLKIKPVQRWIIASAIFLTLVTIILLTDFKTVLSLLIFEKGWRSIEITYSLISLVGISLLLLSLFGVFVMFFKKYEKSVLYALVILSLNILVFYIFEKSFFFMYRINFYYFLLLLGIFGAIGSGFVIDFVGKFSRNKNLSVIFKVVAIVLILFILFQGYYEIENKNHRLNRLISLDEFQALEEMGQKYNGEIVMADIVTSLAIYPVTNNYVVSMLSSNLGGGDAREVHDFFANFDCESKKKSLKRSGATIVFTGEEINCDFLIKDKAENTFYVNLK